MPASGALISDLDMAPFVDFEPMMSFSWKQGKGGSALALSLARINVPGKNRLPSFSGVPYEVWP